MDPLSLCAIMVIATSGALMAGFPVAFTLAGSSLLFAVAGHSLGAFDLSILSAFPQRIFAVATNEFLVAVPLFIFMGVVLERSKIAEDLLKDLGALFGRYRGGLAISVCLVGLLLAASTGIVGATVVVMGLLSLPAMLKAGYDARIASGTIAAAGTLGQIIPPSIVLVILGDQLSAAYRTAQLEQGIFSPQSVNVSDLFAGAFLPGLFLAGLYIIWILVFAWLRPDTMPALADEKRSAINGWQIVWSLAPPIVLMVAVLGSIVGGLASPAEAAGIGAAGAIVLAGHKQAAGKKFIVLGAGLSIAGLAVLSAAFDLRLLVDETSLPNLVAFALAIALSLLLMLAIAQSIKQLHRRGTGGRPSVLVQVMRSTLKITAMIFAILIGATLFSLVVRGFGGDLWIENALANLPGGTGTALFLVLLVMFAMGFFLDFLEIVFIVVPIVAPILLQLEFTGGGAVSPIWLGVMFAIVLQTSFLTPPFGFALFYLRGVAPKAVGTGDIYRGIMPFVAIQLLMLVMLWFLPEFATWLPQALYGR